MARNKGLHKSKAWLDQRFRMERKTLREMADEAGVSIEMINLSLRSYGLK